MPTVRRHTRQVSPTALPGARRSAAATALSEGAGLSQERARTAETLGQAVGQVADRGLQLWDRLTTEAREEANEIALLSATRELGDWEREHMLDAERGALNVKGEAAFDLPKTVLESFDKTAAEIETGLANDAQRLAFARARERQRQQVAMTVERHVAGEIATFEQGELEGARDTAIALAIEHAQDPPRIDVELAKAETAIRVLGQRQGRGPEAVARQVALARSTVHVGAISRLIETDQTAQARAYFAEAKDEIDGTLLGGVERALQEANVRTDAKRKVDALVAAGGTLSEQLEAANAIEDVKLGDEVKRRLRERDADVKRATEDHRRDFLRRAYDRLDAGQGLDAIPATQMVLFDGGERASLRAYADARRRGVAIETQPEALYTLLTLSSTDRDAFLTTNLLTYKHRLSAGDLEQMMRLQASLRGGKDSAGLFASERIQNQIVDEGIAALGLDLTPTELRKDKVLSDRVGAFRRSVREAVRRHEAASGKPATDADVQSIVDTLIAPVGSRVIKDGFFWDTTAPAHAFEVAQAQIARVDQVPAGERRKIEAALRRAGQPVSDTAIVTLFNAQLARVRGDR